jgi:PhnB protein
MVQQQRNASHQKTAIAPVLSVRRGARAIEFYKAAFGAAVTHRVDAPYGAVVAQLSVDGAEFWVADESLEHKNFSPESLGGGTVRIVMVVDDPDAAFDRAVKAGAAVVWGASDQHGWRIGRIADPFGHHWEIGKPLPRLSRAPRSCLYDSAPVSLVGRFPRGSTPARRRR